MNKLFKTLFLFLTVSFFVISCENKDDDSKSETTPDTMAMVEDEEEENNDDDTAETTFKFEAGDYNISWAGSPFKTTLTKKDENTLTGNFCVNNNISNCENLGPITIVRNENTATFHFEDNVCRISESLPGEFNGTGTLTSDNTYSFSVNGEDCKRTYTDNRVIFTKQ